MRTVLTRLLIALIAAPASPERRLRPAGIHRYSGNQLRFATFIITTILVAVPGMGRAAPLIGSLDATLIPYQFGKNPAGLLEKRLIAITRNAGVYCEYLPDKG